MGKKILFVEDDPELLSSLGTYFRTRGFEVETVPTAEAALGRLHAFTPDLVVTDVRLSEMSGMELLERVGKASPPPAVIVITGYQTMRGTIEAIRAGAYEYLVKPLDLGALDLVVERCFRDLAGTPRTDASGGTAPEAEPLGVGRSPEMVEIFKLIGRVAGIRTAVLIRGETGTGKEVVARAIHEYSPWAAEPFVAINCASLTETLLEAELFGHVRGAFTGAVAERRGRFELAGCGTIFLDEIGDTSPNFQTKLLRVIQEREFFPVGSERVRRTEARVIAATHRPIEEMVEDGSFREDLYFRLRVVEIRIPALRDRRADLPALTEHLLRKACGALGREVPRISARVHRMLRDYAWPGNVRELENVLLRAAILCQGPSLWPEHVQLGVQPGGNGLEDPAASAPESQTLEEVEWRHVRKVLHGTGENKLKTAKLLGISRPRLDRILAQHQKSD